MFINKEVNFWVALANVNGIIGRLALPRSQLSCAMELPLSSFPPILVRCCLELKPRIKNGTLEPQGRPLVGSRRRVTMYQNFGHVSLMNTTALSLQEKTTGSAAVLSLDWDSRKQDPAAESGKGFNPSPATRTGSQ
jgi:hypothetical protein